MYNLTPGTSSLTSSAPPTAMGLWPVPCGCPQAARPDQQNSDSLSAHKDTEEEAERSKARDVQRESSRTHVSRQGKGSPSVKLEKVELCMPVCLPSSVLATPGCTALTVTPVPGTHKSGGCRRQIRGARLTQKAAAAHTTLWGFPIPCCLPHLNGYHFLL